MWGEPAGTTAAEVVAPAAGVAPAADPPLPVKPEAAVVDPDAVPPAVAPPAAVPAAVVPAVVVAPVGVVPVVPAVVVDVVVVDVNEGDVAAVLLAEGPVPPALHAATLNV